MSSFLIRHGETSQGLCRPQAPEITPVGPRIAQKSVDGLTKKTSALDALKNRPDSAGMPLTATAGGHILGAKPLGDFS
jgi:hypothetical protein